MVLWFISSVLNISTVYANIGDIGHWRDSIGGQIPGTGFGGFNFDQQIRNDGIYSKPSDDIFQLNEAGDYLIIATTSDEDTSNGRYNSQLKVEQTLGSGDFFTTHYTGYSRDNSENISWTRAVSVVIGASAGSQIQIQKRRDTDDPTGGSIPNASDVQIVRLDQTNHGIYAIAGIGNSYGGTVPNTVSIDSIISQSNTASIEANLVNDSITLKGDNKKYLIAWSASFDGTGARTQRIGHLEYNNSDVLSTRSYCYNRNGANQYCGLGSMDLVETATADINVQTEIYRGDGVAANQGGADVDGTLSSDGNGQIIILEMPDMLEAFRSEDATGGQNVSLAQSLDFARNVSFSDTTSFTRNSNNEISLTNSADVFSWANVWTARADIGSGRRQSSFGSIVVDGVVQSTGQHGNYSRGNQGTQDTFALGFQPAGIYTTSGPGSTIGVNTSPLAGGESGGADTTQPGTVGFFALNLDTLAPPAIDPAPGGVRDNLALWLKADEGTSTTIDGAGLASWADQSGNGLDATAVNAPSYRSNPVDELNYNPVVDFDGVNDYMRNLANGAHSDTYYTVIVPDVDIEGTSSQGVPFSFDCESGILSAGGPCGLPFGGVALGAFTLTIPDEVITHAIGSSANYRSSKTAVITYPAGKPLMIGVNDNPAASITNIYEKGEQIDNEVRNTYQTLSNADYGLGRSMDNANPFLFNGKIAEVINYDGGLNDTERQKIESYLAIKYGMTLNNGTQDYIAADGLTTVWSTSSNAGFNNDIFGIGRDDLQQLGQVQSTSVNNGAIVTIQAQGEGTNRLNSFVDMADNEFLMSGHNNGGNFWNGTDAPIGFGILDRKWKVQETGDVGSVNISFDVADPNFDVPNLGSGISHYFIYDSDVDGVLSDEIPIPMINTSGDIWQISGINLESDMIYTIGSQAGSNNLPTDIGISATSANENVANGSLLAVLSTTDADPLDSHSYSFVSGLGDSDNNRFSITGSNINFNHSPDHEIQDTYNIRIQTDDGNGGTYQESFIITINDIGEAISSTIDLEDIEDEDKYTVGSGQWNNNTVNPHTGTNALESNNGGLNNTQSCFQLTHDAATDGFIEFEYSVSSQAGSDELRFYIDNVQTQQWSGIIPYTRYSSAIQSPGPHTYKWCYVKDGGGSAGSDNAYIDDINFINAASDTTPPTITGTNFASGALLPGGNHNIVINYSDSESGIDSASTIMQLYKWDGVSSYGSNIAGAGIIFNSASSASASYTTNNLSFGKYQYRFSISDNEGNPVVYIHDFYIDEPEFIIGNAEIDLGNLSHISNTFSDTVTLTVRTIGAGFDITMDRSSPFTQGVENIQSYDGTQGYGYQKDPFSGNISPIGVSENIATQAQSINTNGLKNTYTFDIQIGALIDLEQAAGDYEGNLDFGINLTY